MPFDGEVLGSVDRPLQMLARRSWGCLVAGPRMELVLSWGMCFRLVELCSSQPIRAPVESCRELSQRER